MNTLAYIKLNRITGEEIDHGKRNAWLFVRADEGESQVDAIAMMRLFRSVCETEGFHIIGESVFIGNETGTEHFLKAFITRIPFVDCIVTPSIHSELCQSVLQVFLREGVVLAVFVVISILRAFHNRKPTCNS